MFTLILIFFHCIYCFDFCHNDDDSKQFFYWSISNHCLLDYGLKVINGTNKSMDLLSNCEYLSNGSLLFYKENNNHYYLGLIPPIYSSPENKSVGCFEPSYYQILKNLCKSIGKLLRRKNL